MFFMFLCLKERRVFHVKGTGLHPDSLRSLEEKGITRSGRVASITSHQMALNKCN